MCYTKVSKNPIAAGDLGWIFARNCERSEQLRNIGKWGVSMTLDNNYIRRNAYVSRRSKQRRRQRRVRIIVGISLLLIILAAMVAGVCFIKQKKGASDTPLSQETIVEGSRSQTSVSIPSPETATAAVNVPAIAENSALNLLLSDAEALAASYDYDGAIELLKSNTACAEEIADKDAIARYEETKATLVRVNPGEITHVFFHSLIMDNSKAFDGDYDSAGYNQVMTTRSEFLKILEQMYERGYVLVKMHDIGYEVTTENGDVKFVAGDIMLPPDKKAFVMSQDDVNYYEYMEGDGFARRIIVGEDGKPTCEMVMDDGSISVGAYDLVPLLEDFIAEHPDFSYKGARAVLAFTGYQGVFGYRTDPEYKDSNPNYEEDCEMVRQVAQCLRDNGWELASHSWGHINMRDRDFHSVKTDADKWENRVESLIGETDIILYPFGADVGDWKPYTMKNEKYKYLYELGFRYFCNVDSSPYWVQITDESMRQGRRNLDGYRMYYDLPETNPAKTYLDDLFDVMTVFDPDRPTPVPPM